MTVKEMLEKLKVFDIDMNEAELEAHLVRQEKVFADIKSLVGDVEVNLEEALEEDIYD
jgi:hypothetical protein